ncbi:co-chaperone GroES [Candidatus Berkelbacteria bacterium]|nr:co-chaperone GroES [Candidatus Berkelbacteria bacterium]
MFAIQPLGDRVLLKLLPAEETTHSGIIIPDTAKDKSQQATVVAVGPGKRDKDGKRIELDVKESDVVLIPQYGGDEIKYEGEEYKIVGADDILARVTKK